MYLSGMIALTFTFMIANTIDYRNRIQVQINRNHAMYKMILIDREISTLADTAINSLICQNCDKVNYILMEKHKKEQEYNKQIDEYTKLP